MVVGCRNGSGFLLPSNPWILGYYDSLQLRQPHWFLYRGCRTEHNYRYGDACPTDPNCMAPSYFYYAKSRPVNYLSDRRIVSVSLVPCALSKTNLIPFGNPLTFTTLLCRVIIASLIRLAELTKRKDVDPTCESICRLKKIKSSNIG